VFQYGDRIVTMSDGRVESVVRRDGKVPFGH
jgi:hypothetical protein